MRQLLSIYFVYMAQCACYGMEIAKTEEHNEQKKYQKIAILLRKQFGFSNETPDNRRHIRLSADGSTVYTNYYTDLMSFDACTGKRITKIKGVQGNVRPFIKDFTVSSDEQFAAALTEDTILLYDLYYKTVKSSPTCIPLTSVMCHEKSHGVSIFEDEWVSIYDSSLKKINTRKFQYAYPFFGLQVFDYSSFIYSLGGESLIVASKDTTFVWSSFGYGISGKMQILGPVRHKPVACEAYKLAFVTSAQNDCAVIYIVSLKDKLLQEIYIKDKNILALAINNEATRVAYAYRDGTKIKVVKFDPSIITPVDKPTLGDGASKIKELHSADKTEAVCRKEFLNDDVTISAFMFFGKSNAYMRLVCNNGYIEDVNMLAEVRNDDI